MVETAVQPVESNAPHGLDSMSEDRLDWLENQGRLYGGEWLSRTLFSAAMVLTVTVAVVAIALGLFR